MKILIGMNLLPPSWVEVLAEKGFEAVHWSKIGDFGTTEIITKALNQFEDELEKGALLSVDRHKARARILPSKAYCPLFAMNCLATSYHLCLPRAMSTPLNSFLYSTGAKPIALGGLWTFC